MQPAVLGQLERRRQRALEEIKRVIPRRGHPVFTSFEVVSASGRTYRVQIRSLTELRNSCTCPDYRTNLLGSCKHIEGVLLHLKRRWGRRLASIAARGSVPAQIYLDYAQEPPAVRVSLPLPRDGALRSLLSRAFDAEGMLQGPPGGALPSLLDAAEKLPSRLQAGLQVEDAVREHLDLLQDREAVEKQKEWFREQVARGARSLDVIGTRLYPYQEAGTLYLAFGRRVMLADDMGLGKTVQAIAACALLHELRDVRRVLVICPASLKHQWEREIRKLTALPVTVVEGARPLRRDLYARSSFFTVLNYELVLREGPILERIRPDIIILDEAQRIKNWRAKTADAVKRLQSRYAFVLTGTPLENRLDELYSILQFLDPRILGPLWKFNERYFHLERRKDGSHKVLGYKNLDELRARIAPVALRRTRDEVLRELPPRVDNNFFVDLTPPQREAYEGYAAVVAKLFSIAQRRPLTPKERDILLKSLIKMRIICNALALHDLTLPPRERERTAPKLAELRSILEEQVAGNGAKALVFSQWAGMLALAEPGLRRMGLGYVKLTGSVPSSRRGQLIERFFEDDGCRVFLSTDAGGVGLNLQAASLVVNLDLPWNPAVLDQRVSRAHRHGQPRPVNVVNLIARDTIEERMLDTLAAKRHVFEGVFGTEEAPSAISFRDTGQDLLRRLADLLEPPARPEPLGEIAAVEEEGPSSAPAPTVRGFSDKLVSRFPGRILLVRRAPRIGAPAADRILVIVDREPADLRPPIEALLREHFREGAAPELHLMEREGYRTLLALGGEPGRQDDDEESYRAPSLPPTFVEEARERRLRRAREALEHAARRLRFAEVVAAGGFPEEALRPIRDTLGWGLSAGLALSKDREPGPDLPSPREVQNELVETGRLREELVMRLSRVRELTEPPAGDPPSTPPSGKTVATLATAARELIETLERQVVAAHL